MKHITQNPMQQGTYGVAMSGIAVCLTPFSTIDFLHLERRKSR